MKNLRTMVDHNASLSSHVHSIARTSTFPTRKERRKAYVECLEAWHGAPAGPSQMSPPVPESEPMVAPAWSFGSAAKENPNGSKMERRNMIRTFYDSVSPDVWRPFSWTSLSFTELTHQGPPRIHNGSEASSYGRAMERLTEGGRGSTRAKRRVAMAECFKRQHMTQPNLSSSSSHTEGTGSPKRQRRPDLDQAGKPALRDIRQYTPKSVLCAPGD